MTDPSRTLCQCSVCSHHLVGYDSEGREITGKYVSSRNKAKHRLSDLARPARIDSESEATENEENESASITESLEYDETFPYERHNRLIYFIYMFMCWLTMFCNLSREKCIVALRIVMNIIKESQNSSIPIAMLNKVPKDPRTLVKNSRLGVELVEDICCRTCFKTYKPDRSTPLFCEYKEFSTSTPCNEPLYIQKRLFRGLKDPGSRPQNPSDVQPMSTGVPRCIYARQTITSWLTWLLSKPGIEEAIENWSIKIQNSDRMNDIQHGTAFKNVKWNNTPDSLNISLSMFIDWFNPRGLKISGKVESTGLITFSCLNLPPDIRNKPSHICLAAISPGPNSPDPQTVNHLMNPHIDELIELQSGIFMPTYQYPNKRLVQVRLLCVVGDILATKKAAGFASHNATYFCSWCLAKSVDLPSLQIQLLRTRDSTISAANIMKSAKSTYTREQLLKKSGVRWSDLNRLSYWDPSRNVVLGMMHNWLEGILQTHFRYRWGFHLSSSTMKKHKRKINASTNQPHKRARTDDSLMLLDSESEDDSAEDDEENDILLNAGPDGNLFSEDDIERFWSSMEGLVLPSGISRLPPNLGEEKHGRLSAAQWYSLFAYVIPLVIFDLFVEQPSNLPKESNRCRLLYNTGYLVQCTHIVCSRSLKESDIHRFEVNYKHYSTSMSDLFPEAKIQPNHHFALHIPEQLRTWGPLLSISEFAGERLIGSLQKVHTNHHIDKMSVTMMSRGTQLQRLIDKSEYNDMMREDIEELDDHRRSVVQIYLTNEVYDALLRFVRQSDPNAEHKDVFPVPKGAKQLIGRATPVQSIVGGNSVRVSVLKPNNCILWRDGARKIQYGLVQQIYKFQDHLKRKRSVIMVSQIHDQYPKRHYLPTTRFRHLLYLHKVVVGKVDFGTKLFVGPDHVISLAAYRFLPRNSLSIPEDGIILTPQDRKPFLDISTS